MTKMTNEDVKYFIRIGHPRSDMKQLEKAFCEVDLVLTDNRTGKDQRIGRDKAIEVLGRETFLSGISRSAFHASAARESDNGRYSVSFDLYKWWR